MKRLILIILSLAVFSAISFTVVNKFSKKAPVPIYECNDAIGCITIAPGAPLKLGVMHDMSGSAISFGTDQIKSIKIATSRRGERFYNHPIVLLIENSMCSPEGGSVAASKFASNPEIVGVLGPTCSSAAAVAGKIISDAGLVLVTGSSSAPSLTSIEGKPGKDWNPGFFRTMFNIADYGRNIAKFAFRDLDMQRAAVVNDGDAYTKGYSDTFKQMFEKLGGEIVLDATINKGETNMFPVLAAVAASGAEFLFLPLFEREAVLLVQHVKKIAGLENLILFGVNTVLTDSFVKSTGDAGKGMYFLGSAPPPKNAAIRELISEFELRYKEAPRSPTFDYGLDSVNLLLSAVEKVAVREMDGTVHIGRQALRDALRATTAFKGISGIIKCDQYGDCGVARFNIVRLDDPEKGIEGLKTNIISSQTNQ